MTATPVLADRGLLSALAIAYAHAGVPNRDDRLADAAAHVGRPLTTTAELTAEEARALRRHVRRCSPDTCRFTTAVRTSPAGDEKTRPLALGRENRVVWQDPSAPAPAILCAPRGQEPTARDRALVEAFAEQLAGARPARTVHRHDPGCSPTGGHLIPAGVGIRHCACGGVADVPPARDRSCPPAVCYCGTCPWWTPAPPVNYAAAIAKLAEAGDQR